jgi:hypothetical protein
MDGAPPRTPSEQFAQHETLQCKPDRSRANKTGQIEKLTTAPGEQTAQNQVILLLNFFDES